MFSLRSTGVAGCRLLGTAGAALVTLAGWSAGVPLLASPALLVAFCGVTLLVAAWWWAGQDLAGPRSLLGTLACWCAPLAVAPPMFSRDAYSYLAQGAMVARHIDVYAHGVAYLGGPLAAQVPAMWLDTPAPYGPVFLELAGWNASASGRGLVGGLIGLRLLAIAGVAVFTAILPYLAEALGFDKSAALWLGALNPLIPLHLVAGMHNEAVMLALLGSGLLLALKKHYAIAAVAVTLAALVKAPAALALPTVAMMWGSRAVVKVSAIGGATAVAVSATTGLGFGWIPALRAPAGTQYSWSISSTLGRATQDIVPREFWTGLGIAAAAVLIGLIWLRRGKLGPVYGLGLALAAVAFLGPATRPWYALWGLIPLAAAAPPGQGRKLAAATSAALAFAVVPSGYGPDGEQLVIAAAGVAAGVLVLLGSGLIKPARRLVPA